MEWLMENFLETAQGAPCQAVSKDMPEHELPLRVIKHSSNPFPNLVITLTVIRQGSHDMPRLVLI
jgi:hypothetical protein